MKKQFQETILIKKQVGFSLLQLIIVIVTFGALAVYFAPRFLNLQGEAHASILETLQVSIQAEISVVHGEAIVKSVHNKANASIELDSEKMVDIVYGYPAATEAAFKAFLDTKFASDNTGEFNIKRFVHQISRIAKVLSDLRIGVVEIYVMQEHRAWR